MWCINWYLAVRCQRNGSQTTLRTNALAASCQVHAAPEIGQLVWNTCCWFAGAGLSVTLPDGTAVVRRVIDADNSCLFNAVGYVMQGSRSRAPALRSVLFLCIGRGRASCKTRTQVKLPLCNEQLRSQVSKLPGVLTPLEHL